MRLVLFHNELLPLAQIVVSISFFIEQLLILYKSSNYIYSTLCFQNINLTYLNHLIILYL